MNRNRAFLTLRLALLISVFVFGFLLIALPKPAAAQSDITDDETVDVTDDFCDPDEGDDCEVESVASILDSSNQTDIDTYDATFITEDLLDYGYEAYVEGYLYQDDTLIADGDAYDEGDGAAEVDGATTINLADGPYAYELDTDSYLYDGEEYYDILSTEADATLGAPVVTSVSPPYVYVGRSGTVTINGQALVNPFGGSSTSVSAVPATTGATGLTLSGDSFSDTSGTADYTTTLTATTGPWDIGLSTEFGGTFYATTTKGLFTVGDPTPSITTVNPSTWTAGQLNFPVTISGSYFGSNPELAVSGGGATATITSHTDTGAADGATINASVSVPNACDAAGSVVITVTSTGYNGTGFVPAFSGQSSSGTATATIVPAPVPAGAAAPTITFAGKNVAGATTSVVVGQQISLTGVVPAQACVSVKNWNWTPPTGTAIGGYTPTATSYATGTVKSLPAATANPYTFYWAYPGTFTASVSYTLTNGDTSPTSTATFTVTGPTGGKMTFTPYTAVSVDAMNSCVINGVTIPAGPWLNYGNYREAVQLQREQ